MIKKVFDQPCPGLDHSPNLPNEPGVYEHTCSYCHRTVIFTVHSVAYGVVPTVYPPTVPSDTLRGGITTNPPYPPLPPDALSGGGTGSTRWVDVEWSEDQATSSPKVPRRSYG